MTPILTAITFLRSSRTAQAVLVVIACGLAALGFKLWLGAHDRAVRAEYLTELREQARKDSDKAKATADQQSAKRKEQTDEVQDRISNSSSVDELFERLRGHGGAK